MKRPKLWRDIVEERKETGEKIDHREQDITMSCRLERLAEGDDDEYVQEIAQWAYERIRQLTEYHRRNWRMAEKLEKHRAGLDDNDVVAAINWAMIRMDNLESAVEALCQPVYSWIVDRED